MKIKMILIVLLLLAATTILAFAESPSKSLITTPSKSPSTTALKKPLDITLKGPLSINWYVDSSEGNDRTGDGSSTDPFKTITRALEAASSGDKIKVKVGNAYDEANGEVFPLRMKGGVDMEGLRIYAINGSLMPVIQGGASYAIPGDTDRYVSILGADDATISGFRFYSTNTPGATYGSKDGTSILCDGTSPTIEGNEFTGYGHAGIATLGSAHPVIRDNEFQGWASLWSPNWGITLYGESYPVIESNEFTGTNGVDCSDRSHPTIDGNTFSCQHPGEGSSVGISTKGESNPTIINNDISGNGDYGIIVRMDSTPVIQDNVITNNPTGIFIGGGVNQNPDIGGGGRSHGGNTFNNTNWDIENWTGNTISAKGNGWSNGPCCEIIDERDIFDDDENSAYGAVNFGTCIICTAIATLPLPSS
jgi:parallel beta-helix repeat protein